MLDELSEIPSGIDLDIMMEYDARRRCSKAFLFVYVRIDGVGCDCVVFQPRFSRIYRGGFDRT